MFALFGGNDGPSWHATADLMTAACFAAASVGGAMLHGGKAQRQWYDGRASAESAKSLTWKYVMCSAPFGSDVTADDAFIERLADIRRTLNPLTGAGPEVLTPDAAISPAMRRLRSMPVEVKRRVYHDARLADQIVWYETKARDAARRARRWQYVTAAVGTAGVIGALIRASGKVDVDMLGLAAAALASFAAWVQLRQYWPNTAAYNLAVRELQQIVSESLTVPDDPGAWAAFCEKAEYAISREHTMWRARTR